MRLYPVEPSSKLAAKIAGISKKKLRMDVLIKETDIRTLDTLVVIGNGTPDDIAVSIVAFHLNGDKIAGIVKPKTERRYGFISVIPLYLKDKVRKVLVLMDQEDDQLNAISERIQTDWKELTKSALEVIESDGEERVRIFKGKYGSKEFKLILVINGLDAIHTDKHSIEDHLVSAAQQVSIAVGDFENSKAAWRLLSNDQQLRIYKELKAHRRLAESVFPQQVLGCRYLNEES
ncbi:MAG: hypothetical protein IBX41_02880 [Methanophagales archaeon]|nr:hypothetical protein [Methanophagales archaeon]